MSPNSEPEEQIVPRTTRTKSDFVDAIATCLKQDDLIGGFVEGHVGRIGTFENVPSYIEIGLTEDEPTGEFLAARYLVTVHLWSKSENPKVLQSVLDAAECAIAASNSHLALKREYTEVRFDERASSLHGLLRVSISSSMKALGTDD